MNILSFDIEEWFHILDNESTKSEANWLTYEYRLDQNMERIFDLLERKNQKATFFCMGWIARKHPHIIRKIHEQGYEIASHSDMHQLVYEQNRREFTEDLKRSLGSIEDITGTKVRVYRAPGFSIGEEEKWAFEILIENGIKIDSSIFPAKRAHGGFASFGHAEPTLINIGGVTIKEFPINLYHLLGKKMIFSGGGYFRVIPYWLIRHMMRQSNYVKTYFHPRDFDPDQPIITDLSTFRKFKSYYGLGSAFEKLEKLIDDFEFVDLEKADEMIDWENVKTLKL